MKIEKIVRCTDPNMDWLRDRLQEAGTQIASVHFRKRSNNKLRKMCFRLKVKNPSVAIAPSGSKKSNDKFQTISTVSTGTELVCKYCGRKKGECVGGPFIAKTVKRVDSVQVPKARMVKSKREIDLKNNQMTVLDVNKVVRDSEGKVLGRGAWRTIPLENVERICVKGTVYEIAYSK